MASIFCALRQELGLEIQSLGYIEHHEQQVRLAANGDALEGNERIAQFSGLGTDLGLDVPHRFLFLRRLRAVIEAEAQFERSMAEQFLPRVTGHLEKGVVHIDEAILARRLDDERNRAGPEGLGKTLLGAAQFGIAVLERAGALLHHPVQRLDPQVRLLGDVPLLGERVGQLQHLDVVEGLFEDDEVVIDAEAHGHLFPRVIRVGGADDDLEAGVHLPQILDGFHAVPSRRHAHIDKGQRVRLPVFHRLDDFLQRLLALVSGFELELRDIHRHARGVEKHGFHRVQFRARLRRTEQDFAKVLVDGRVVVHEQNAIVQLATVHAGVGGAAQRQLEE